MTTTPGKPHTDAGDAAANQPARSDAPASADAGDAADSSQVQPQGSPAAPVMKQFSKTQAESGGERK